MRGRFFYTIGIAFASGIFLRSFFDIGYAGIGFSFVLGVSFVCAWRIKTKGINSPLFLSSLFFIFLALGLLRLEMSEVSGSVFGEYEGEKVLFVGKIAREPEVRETNTHLYIDPTDIGNDSDELVLVTTDKFSNPGVGLAYGDTVYVEGTLELPESFETDTGRMFDYPGYLKARGIEYVVSFGKVTLEKEEEGTFLGALFRGKNTFMRTVEEAIPEPHAGLGEGVLLGVKRAIGKDLEQTFRETGIIHIVVLSGYNIMIVVECMTFVLAYLFRPRMQMVLGIGIILLFALLVGLSATVIRASMMAGLLLIARGTGRTYAVLRALIFAGVLMLIHNPYLLVHDPGFQLSFLATLGLILLSPPIESRLIYIPTMIGMRKFVTATLATQIFVLPLLLYQMGMFSAVAVLVNVLVLPMVPVAMLLTFLTGIFGMISSTLGLGIGYVTYLSLEYIIKVAEFFGSLPFASSQVGVFPFWVVLCTYGVMTVVLSVLLKNKDEGTHIDDLVPKKTETTNDYEGWTIVEEIPKIKKSVEAHNASTDSSFPFR